MLDYTKDDHDLRQGGIAVYCGSSMGTQKAYVAAAESLGKALATRNRPLVYGGGVKGIMGVVSNSVLAHGGEVTGIIPYAMVAGGGEKPKSDEEDGVELQDTRRERVKTVVVQSMHERKVEMAKRVDGFIGLPGGYGTFEEVLEVTTWTQLGIHDKPVVLVNILGFWNPLRELIRQSVQAGFIRTASEKLIIFIDGPTNQEEHMTFDWGSAALTAIDDWELGNNNPLFDWTLKMNGAAEKKKSDKLIAT
ncbi:hypothetical protein AGABI2DRAFT_199661 [Agaricus bisporus var. bisporus H97]|uniref:hypothetical protein n=1 Tax=Agaricus bisporus var. bisporus (strain H97 / ATCC MYA-4626 / FGSC 10389) TaxID=936046 RepID=UPI00029F7639|nr:hypothetical protein AGABI2DRAFT_199661 [Agaricus bisporus var. bisporus H97]EKV50183.1 hypothetical protein AGABI2DRAFT_199661 [Agaricus bisporus var. bisporus H97]